MSLGAREGSLDALLVGPQGRAQEAQHRTRVLFPARGRELGLADRTVAVELEEAEERAAGGAVGDGVEPRRRLTLEDRLRLGLAPGEGHDVHQADAGPRALEIVDAARQRLGEPLGVERRDALEHLLQCEVRSEGARRAGEHDRPGALEERLDVAQTAREPIIGENGEVESALRAALLLGEGLELADVVVERDLLAQQARRGDWEARVEAAAAHSLDLHGELVTPPAAPEARRGCAGRGTAPEPRCA